MCELVSCDMEEKEYYTYILRCSDDSLYTGYTTDLAHRVDVHNAKKGAKYTKGRTPVTLVYYEVFATKQLAMQREAAIKKLSRKEKLALIGAGDGKIEKDSSFLIEYEFFDETRETEIEFIIDGENILSFSRDNKVVTTRWNLDELVMWLRNFIDDLQQDPYPVDVDGEYAAIKDINAREFDFDDEEFDSYYDKLDEWNNRHRWHPHSQGAILADLYFQLVDDYVEISWNNQDVEEGVNFNCILGGARVSRVLFCEEVNSFLRDYVIHWFSV